ncbi:hypothetical protein QAD02_021218 [Eretmocerus hayati]|uniref:Uncharacterized protein n=1 Tax=Eretmocerus hayati TaxID=131215 RepID=A0ACC2PUF6_9HYME|nr:hypothetical protein QAD02_021218 [Eretmocerus hayati]
MGKADMQQKASNAHEQNDSQNTEQNSTKSFLRSVDPKPNFGTNARNPRSEGTAERPEEIIKETVMEVLSIKETERNEERAALLRREEFLEQREESKMRQEKRNKIVIRGIQLDTRNGKREIESFLKENLQVKVEASEVNTIQVARGKNLFVAKMSGMEEGMSVMKSKKNLQNASITRADSRWQGDVLMMKDFCHKHRQTTLPAPGASTAEGLPTIDEHHQKFDVTALHPAMMTKDPNDSDLEFCKELTTLASFVNRKLVNFHGIVLIREDFNVRIGNSDQVPEDSMEGLVYSHTRESRDKIQNKQGSALVADFEDLGLFILIGRSPADSEGDYTFVGERGNSTIDHIWAN